MIKFMITTDISNNTANHIFTDLTHTTSTVLRFQSPKH